MESYREWLNQEPIKFPLHPKKPIHKIYNNTSCSHVGDEDNDTKFHMDGFLWDIHAMNGML